MAHEDHDEDHDEDRNKSTFHKLTARAPEPKRRRATGPKEKQQLNTEMSGLPRVHWEAMVDAPSPSRMPEQHPTRTPRRSKRAQIETRSASARQNARRSPQFEGPRSSLAAVAAQAREQLLEGERRHSASQAVVGQVQLAQITELSQRVEQSSVIRLVW